MNKRVPVLFIIAPTRLPADIHRIPTRMKKAIRVSRIQRSSSTVTTLHGLGSRKRFIGHRCSKEILRANKQSGNSHAIGLPEKETTDNQSVSEIKAGEKGGDGVKIIGKGSHKCEASSAEGRT